MKENFTNLARESDISLGSSENPKQAVPKEDHRKTHHN